MIFLAIGLLAAAIAAFALFQYAQDGYGGMNFIAGCFAFLLAAAVGISSIGFVFWGFGWLAAEQKANIINREYDAKYTQKEVFYASDVIDTVRQLDRKRIEVNGDLMREKEGK